MEASLHGYFVSLSGALSIGKYRKKNADESILIGVNRIQIIRFFAMLLDRILKVGFSELTKLVLQDDVLGRLCIISKQNSDENMAFGL